MQIIVTFQDQSSEESGMMTPTPILLSDNSSGVEADSAADAVDAASPTPSIQFYTQVRKILRPTHTG